MRTVSEIRVLSWNIYEGGRGVGGETNLEKIANFAASLKPDIFCCVETYGAAGVIQEEMRSVNPEFKGFQITHRPNNGDNLWIFTALPVITEYQPVTRDSISTMNFGGVRVQLPGGGTLSVFDIWLKFDFDLDPSEVVERVLDSPPGSPAPSRSEVLRSEVVQRENISDILWHHLPVCLPDKAEPVILAGDFNTESHLDWWDAPRWERLGGSWQVTKLLENAGFTDTYRVANPDHATAPGSTWSPAHDELKYPHRIDFIFSKGPSVRVQNSRMLDQRAPTDGPGEFYSDHAAVVTDLLIDGG